MQQLRLKIDGMHCSGCVRRVEGLINSVPGVGVENVTVGAASLRVNSDKVSTATVANALSAQGYPAREEVPNEPG